MAGNEAKKADEKTSKKKPKKATARLTIGNLAGFAAQSVGDKFYVLGTVITRYRRNYWRSFKNVAGNVWKAVFGVLKKGGALAARGVNAVWKDLTMPFVMLGRTLKNYAALRKSIKGRDPAYRKERVRQFFKSGWQRNKHLLGRMFNYLAPAMSLVLCLAVVLTMLSLNYAIRVSYNGETIGYIENEAVYDSARKIIENRIISGTDGPIWSNDTELGIAVVAKRDMVSQDIMAESLLKASESEIKNATGIYIGGELYGATEDGDALIAAIEGVKEPFLAVATEMGNDAAVKFAREVEYVSGIFPASSVRPLDELLADVTSTAPRDIYVTAKVGDNVTDILRLNGLTLAQLMDLNPSVTDYTFTENSAQLLVARGEPLIRVKLVRVLSYVETMSYGTEVTYSSDHQTGTVLFLQHGEMGERTVTKEMEYDANGRLLTETVVSEVVTKEPVSQSILVGTQGGPAIGGSGGGVMTWPTVSSGWMVTRGWSASATSPHGGIDIAAPFGTPIYAAEGGTVTTALYTSESYGNYVIIDHGNGISTLYAHCSALLVQQGQQVARGQMIALMGSTGNSTGNHLHFEVRIDGIRVPPEEWIGYRY